MKKLLLAAALLGLLPFSAHAAGLTYSADTAISLTGTSPAVTLTIASGSGADTVTVNTTDVTVSIPSGTQFTISSPYYALVVNGATSNAVISNACASDKTNTVTVSSSNTSTQNLTITIASYQCGGQSSNVGSGAGGGGGGGGGGGSIITTPPVATTTTTTATATSTPSTGTGTTNGTGSGNSDITALLNQLISLIKLADAQGLTISPELKAIAGIGATGMSGGGAGAGGRYFFQHNLQYGMHGDEVRELQLFLIGKDLGAAAKALHAYGANGNFGNLTKAALVEYQKAKKISPAVGYFGPTTRSMVNSDY